MQKFSGKNVLITGGTRGIGFALAQVFAKEGARVALIGTDDVRTREAADQINQSGGVARGYVLDVTDIGGWTDIAPRIQQEFGPIDVLVLNAGGQGARQNIEKIAPAEWQWVWDVNVNGVFYGLRTFLPEMKARNEEGHVVITSSIGALFPRADASAYGAAKAASLAIAEALNVELQDSSINVSVLCPGLVRTSSRETNRRHAPGADDETFKFMVVPAGQGMAAQSYAELVVRAIKKNEFYVFSHPEVHHFADRNLDLRKAALGQVS
jgi:NAD(P)-dependent dehydrogenase (short-subunit alcohol dehydrogenase family)